MKLEGWIVRINQRYVACDDKEFLKGITRRFGYTHVDDKNILKITLTHPDPITIPDTPDVINEATHETRSSTGHIPDTGEEGKDG